MTSPSAPSTATGTAPSPGPVDGSAVHPTTGPADAVGLDRENPWPGLASFTEAQAAFFHGRDREVGQLLEIVRSAKLTTLFGQSGLGKTSLLRAGLFPRLRHDDFLPVAIRVDYAAAASPPPEQVLVALGAAVPESHIDAPPPNAGESLWEYFHRRDVDFWSPRNQLVTPVLVFDQFEEIFTLGQSGDAARHRAGLLLDELSQLVENRPPRGLKAQWDAGDGDPARYDFDRPGCKVLLSLREDFLADLEGLRPHFRTVLLNRMRLESMTGAQAAEVIDLAGGHLVEPGVTRRIVAFVATGGDANEAGSDIIETARGDESDGVSDGAETAEREHRQSGTADSDPIAPRLRHGASAPETAELRVEPALLAVVCTELNARRRERGLDRITAGLVAESRQEILTDFYERSVRDLPPAARKFIEDKLLTRAGYRNSAALEEALEGDGTDPPALNQEVLDRLVARRLLRVEERLRSQRVELRVELTHDVLAGPVRSSRDARHHREALAVAEEAARRAVAEARRRRRVLIFVAAIALLLIGSLSGLTIVAVRKGSEAERQRRAAAALASAARQNLIDLYVRDGWARADSGDPSVSLLYFARAVEIAAGDRWAEEDARIRFATMLATLPPLMNLPEGTLNEPGTLSPSARLWIDGNAVTVIDRSTGRTVCTLPHKGLVHSAQFSPDGRWVVTGSEDTTAQVWEAATGRRVSPPIPHRGAVYAVAFSPEGKRVVTAGADHTARVWDAATGLPLSPPLPHDGAVWHAVFSPDGTRIATCSEDATAHVWDAADGRDVFPPLRHGLGILTVEFSPDGKLLATGGRDREARLWDAADGHLRFRLAHDAVVQCLVFDADGRRLMTGSQGRVARVWRTDTGEAVSPWLWHSTEVASVQFAGGGALAGAGPKHYIDRVWGLSGVQQPVVEIRRKGNVLAAAFSPDGSRVATGSDDGAARVWSVATGRPLTPPLPHNAVVRTVAFSRDGRRVVTSSDDHSARVWDAATGVPLTPPLWHKHIVYSAEFSPDGGRVVTASRDDTARIWDAVGGKELHRFEVGTGVWCATFSPDGARVAAAGDDGQIWVWDSNTERRLAHMKHDDRVYTIAFSPDGTRILTASKDKSARVWDSASGAPAADPLRHENAVRIAAFSPDGKLVATGSFDSTVRVWDAATSRPLTPWLRHEGGVRSIAFSPDSRRLVTGSDGNSGRVWEVARGLPLTPLLRHPGEVWAVAYSPDGRHVLLGGKDGTGATTAGVARIWEVAPDPRPTSDLLALAELFSSHRLDPANGLESVSIDQWKTNWDRLRRLYPTQFPTTPTTQPTTRPGATPTEHDGL